MCVQGHPRSPRDTFISNIFIEPIVEFRFSKNSQKNEFVIGLAFGVSF